MTGYQKISNFCAKAALDGLEYVVLRKGNWETNNIELVIFGKLRLNNLVTCDWTRGNPNWLWQVELRTNRIESNFGPIRILSLRKSVQDQRGTKADSLLG
jgi:hypothetical protein